MRISAVASIVALVGVGLLAADEPLSYATHVRPLFEKECGDCHGPKRPKKGLDLLGAGAVAAMVDRPSQNEPQVMLVKAGDAQASYLWRKLAHTHSEGKGMPRGLFTATRLPQEQIDVVARWIEQGARP